MTLIQVESSNIAGYCYFEDQQTLHIEFKDGRAYQYFDVPTHIVVELAAAESKGRYLNSFIKGTYRYARV